MLNKIRDIVEAYLRTSLTVQAFKVIKVVPTEVGVSLKIALKHPCKTLHDTVASNLKTVLALSFPLVDCAIELITKVETYVVQGSLTPLKEVKNIIAIAAAKGGVGKSTTALNLALALSLEGAKVGLLDADIYGPSQPLLLDVADAASVSADKKILPIHKYNLQTMSIGYLLKDNAPLVWRGPLVSTALSQLVNDTQWHNLDYLLIDLPPGTGDIQLSLCQKIPLAAVIMVTTPQAVAVQDVKKSMSMFQKMNVSILGIIENMSEYECDFCHHKVSLFGTGGGLELSNLFDTPLLGNIPLHIALQEDNPLIKGDLTHSISKIYLQIARQIGALLTLKKKSYANIIPQIHIN
jgi:ATP-binding protein involved in chromosome partitioning